MLEVTEAISCLHTNRAPGIDGIKPCFIRNLPASAIEHICTFMNYVFFSGQYPSEWTTSCIVPIPKKGNPQDPGNYRGISLSQSLAKVYDILISRRLSLWADISACQTGFREGMSCNNHTLSINLLINYCKKTKKKLFLAMLDLSKAFDTIDRGLLMQKLCNIGIGGNMFAAIKSMYSNTKAVVICKNNVSESFTTNLGVKQGMHSLGILFNLFLNDLPSYLSDRFGPDDFLGHLHVLLHGDDSMLLSTTREALLTKLSLFSDYCIRNCLKINWDKSCFLVINGDQTD